ncbi:hypothetical protein [Denitrobaculum tricleocarpae]|uniref:Uncharacterized protein n=1 Tax=Denitrobaculum tricleocarpae TaxID=2591009 RepID=A0A545TUA2_9PROT|nr:hypothetical protein [Denitrobaculum tricleocarpae]TQV80797.1 hypothetical protein FKG95_11655 [Denitrobaculum tricleocarpae]
MDTIRIIFPIAVALVAILAQISVWSPRRLWVKITALVTMTLFLPVAYISLETLLSRPKPVEMDWASENLTDASVLAARIDEEESIYLWLAVAGIDEPRSYVLPWTEETARELHAAQQGAEREGSDVKIRRPSESGEDDQEPMFYAAPQETPPEKQTATTGPQVFQRSASNR